jgi:hypothetical protein
MKDDERDLDLIVGSITKGLRAVVSALLLFGAMSWTSEQTGGFYLAFEAVIGVPATVWLTLRRRKVT